MNEEDSSGPLALGIECGGTRTTTGILDAEGGWSRGREHPAANLALTSDARLLSMFRQMADDCPHPDAVGIGMAGMRTEVDRQRVRQLLRKVWPRARHHATDDLENALSGAGEGKDERAADILIVSGTGASCMGRLSDGTKLRISGWGHVLGDESCGYGIGLAGLRLMVRELDRTGEIPPMLERFIRETGVGSVDELVPWCQTASKSEIAQAALPVFRAWEDGHGDYGAIVTRAADLLVEDALACVARLGHPSPVRFLLNGGCFSRQAGFRALVGRSLVETVPGSTVAPESPDGALGAARLALEQGERTHPLPVNRRETPAILPESGELSPTERRHPDSMNLDRMTIREGMELMAREDARLPSAILEAAEPIERTIRWVCEGLKRGGRLLYFGAGTSGRLGVLDASECPPTFRTPPGQVQGAIAGGHEALMRAVEGAEDSIEAGALEAESRDVRVDDVVVGIAASGRTPFVWGALMAAGKAGAKTVLLCFNPHLGFAEGCRPDAVICPATGPEILTGSTRLKAGTATKMILNMITTLAMVRSGKVIENLMVDVHPTNAKLRERAVRILTTLTGMAPDRARASLVANDWCIPKAREEWRRTAPGS